MVSLKKKASQVLDPNQRTRVARTLKGSARAVESQISSHDKGKMNIGLENLISLLNDCTTELGPRNAKTKAKQAAIWNTDKPQGRKRAAPPARVPVQVKQSKTTKTTNRKFIAATMDSDNEEETEGVHPI